MFHAAIFDMDGLLLDTEGLLCRFWCEAGQEAGYPFTPEHARHLRSLSGPYARQYLCGEFGSTFPFDKVRDTRRAKMAAYLSEHPPVCKPGAHQLLTWLRDHHVLTAVATATDQQRARAYLTQTGLYPLFDKICCAPDVPRGKPMPDVYLAACHQIHQAPSDCLALEDSPNGVLSAWRAGCHVLMVPDQTPPEPWMEPLLFGVCPTLGDVIPLLV